LEKEVLSPSKKRRKVQPEPDASVLTKNSLSWVEEIMQNLDLDVIGYDGFDITMVLLDLSLYNNDGENFF
jgi:hypothetical protein